MSLDKLDLTVPIRIEPPDPPNDGIQWDSGRYLQMRTAGHGAYSNNLWVRNPDDETSGRLLLQASHAYAHHRTNIYHWWLM